jgi:hypothetical protein
MEIIQCVLDYLKKIFFNLLTLKFLFLKAFKTIGITYSNDEGRTWSINENSQIITPPYTKPLSRRWSGNGDFDVVYNPFNGRFMCYYMASKFLFNNPLGVEPVSPQINLASTTDQTAAFSTWMKWNGKLFLYVKFN